MRTTADNEEYIMRTTSLLKSILIALPILASMTACDVVIDTTIHEVRGNKYTFHGTINEDSARAFKQTLSKHDQIEVISLDSSGGYSVYGMEMGDAVLAGGYDTVIESGNQCASACMYLFLSGDKKKMQAPLHVHAPAFNDVPYRKLTDKDMIRLAERNKLNAKLFMAKRGLLPSFIDYTHTIHNETTKAMYSEDINKHWNK